MNRITRALIEASRTLSSAVDSLRFRPPVGVVYNPLQYARAPHESYLRTFGNSRKQALFLGMNPGPFGMVQTGVPFGEVAVVRDWLGITGPVQAPARVHPARPIDGFRCPRSEVSGRRLWGLFAERFGSPSGFFAGHFVANYCPLAFLDEGGRNLTPDKLGSREAAPLFEACDIHLRAVVRALEPEWVIGVGDFAARRAQQALAGERVRLGKVLHPSPASPAANRGWSAAATRQLEALGVW